MRMVGWLDRHAAVLGSNLEHVQHTLLEFLRAVV